MLSRHANVSWKLNDNFVFIPALHLILFMIQNSWDQHDQGSLTFHRSANPGQKSISNSDLREYVGFSFWAIGFVAIAVLFFIFNFLWA